MRKRIQWDSNDEPFFFLTARIADPWKYDEETARDAWAWVERWYAALKNRPQGVTIAFEILDSRFGSGGNQYPFAGEDTSYQCRAVDILCKACSRRTTADDSIFAEFAASVSAFESKKRRAIEQRVLKSERVERRLRREEALRSRTFPYRLRQVRNHMGLRQSEMAERLGVSQVRVSEWETGKKSPSVAEIEDICAKLGVDFGWLANGAELNGRF